MNLAVRIGLSAFFLGGLCFALAIINAVFAEEETDEGMARVKRFGVVGGKIAFYGMIIAILGWIWG